MIWFLIGGIVSVIMYFYALRLYSKYTNTTFKKDTIQLILVGAIVSFIGSWFSIILILFILIIFIFKDRIVKFINGEKEVKY